MLPLSFVKKMASKSPQCQCDNSSYVPHRCLLVTHVTLWLGSMNPYESTSFLSKLTCLLIKHHVCFWEIISSYLSKDRRFAPFYLPKGSCCWWGFTMLHVGQTPSFITKIHGEAVSSEVVNDCAWPSRMVISSDGLSIEISSLHIGHEWFHLEYYDKS